ncbi:serine hydrolase domain-containing protein [Alkalicoccobacillus murimartini]|uniref:CubicO group peptidase (Beta-lactamase class C family) n=1 Tax=Alkalicoccobacillus murimartini TaxID=171685 RepID=A0ABT9YM28_9BACI|nr:serine hydrolase [Alkalicoccobacillus murimartini]MDQ0208796.1 CubicO group peptidase (beta-lactamase class C family) [Alkalicoccobacillus murimartini]
MKIRGIEAKVDKVQKDIQFSGTVYAKLGDEVFTKSYGFANRSEKLENQLDTRYGIASGSKPITAAAIFKLVEQGKLSVDSRLSEYLDKEFPHFDKTMTIHHLLTHTSGIPDYFDEDVMDDFEELWVKHPMYLIRDLSDFLPLFQNEQMKAAPGATFHYNNAGYIVLGLIVEKVSGMLFSDFVETYIFQKLDMADSGYFEMDALPERTALGYIEKPDGGYRTNVYSLPAKSASDGGVYVTVEDMIRFWEGIISYKLLDEELTNLFLKPQVEIEDHFFYGYGHYIETNSEGITRQILMGYDPGVNFRAVFYPKTSLKVVVCSNVSEGAYEMISEIRDQLK